MTFDTAFERLIGHEGGYSNNPADPGGETMWGITKRVALEAGFSGPMHNLSREQAKQIAKKCYWDRASCDQYDPAIGFQMLDATFHHGIGNSVRFLQRAVDVVDDGVVGAITVAAIKKSSVSSVLMKFNSERLMFMTKLSTWPTFGKGWARRIAGNLSYGAEDL